MPDAKLSGSIEKQLSDFLIEDDDFMATPFTDLMLTQRKIMFGK